MISQYSAYIFARSCLDTFLRGLVFKCLTRLLLLLLQCQHTMHVRLALPPCSLSLSPTATPDSKTTKRKGMGSHIPATSEEGTIGLGIGIGAPGMVLSQSMPRLPKRSASANGGTGGANGAGDDERSKGPLSSNNKGSVSAGAQTSPSRHVFQESNGSFAPITALRGIATPKLRASASVTTIADLKKEFFGR